MCKKDKTRSARAKELIRNHIKRDHTLTRKDLLELVSKEVDLEPRSMYKAYEAIMQENLMKAHLKEKVYVPKHKGRTREKFMFDDSKLFIN